MEVLCKQSVILTGCRSAVMNLTIQQQPIQVMVFAIDVTKDSDILLAPKRKRDTEGIGVCISKETILTDELEGGPALQHRGFIVDKNGHKNSRCKLACAKLQRLYQLVKDNV